MRKTQALFFLLAAFFILSCSKKDDPAPLTPAQLLSAKTWILNGLTSTDANFQTTGQILLGSEWSFNSDHSFSIHVNVSGIDLTFTGTWSLAADNKTLTVNSDIGGSPAASNMEILSISTTALELKETVPGMVNNYSYSGK